MDFKLIPNYNFHLGCAIAAILVILMYIYPIIFYIFLLLLYSLILIVCVLYVQHNKNKGNVSKPIPASAILYNATRSRMFDVPRKNKANLSVIFGRRVDNLLQQILGNALDDFINSWLSKVTFDDKELIEILKEDFWIATQKLVERLRKIDVPKIIAVDCVTKATNHLERIRLLKEHEELNFKMSSYLASDEKEIEFLKKISEIVVILLLPRGYSIVPLKNLLCEIITFKVFYSTIKIITNPDYINQKIVDGIQTKLALLAFSRRSYEYANSFKGFIKIIEESNNIDELLQIRSSIINDLMQATTTQNLQLAKGINIEVGTAALKRTDINTALKLKKYIQQLCYAKIQCENVLSKLGWTGHCTNDLNLTLQDVLGSVVGRKYFSKFLESLNATNLVEFYTSVEEMKSAHKNKIHQIGAEIFYAFIRPNFEIKLDKQEQKKLEGFLLGDDSNYHEVFYDIQKKVFGLLDEKYYQPFMHSEEYKKMMTSIGTEDASNISSTSFLKTNFDGNLTVDGHDEYDTEMDLTNHSTYAKNKLEQLQERLKTKKSALEALKSSLKPDSQILSILEKEIENLKNEKRQLESHLMRTEVWTSNLGKWRAQVENVDIPESKDTPEFLIVVQAEETPREATEDDNYDQEENISSGWVVLRTLDDFHELHKKIRPLCAELKSLELPSNNTFILFFGRNDRASLDKAKAQIQKYLNFVMENSKLFESEFLFAFLSPSCDHLKVSTSPKKSKMFSLATFFKSGSSSTTSHHQFWTRENDDDDDFLLVTDNNDGNAENARENKLNQQFDEIKDSIVEPIYQLLSEIFDLTGPFKFLRKSLISFVQLTYGGSLNRQLRDFILSFFDESNLHHYASICLKSFWPNEDEEEEIKATEERTDDMKEMTAFAARALFIDNVPDILCSLVGQQNAKNGLLKIFEVLQNENYNKQLIYDLLEVFLVEIFPEIKCIPTSK